MRIEIYRVIVNEVPYCFRTSEAAKEFVKEVVAKGEKVRVKIFIKE